MLEISQAYQDELARGAARPVLILALYTGLGRHLWSDQGLGDELLATAGPFYADGSWYADGSITGGADSIPILSHGDLVQSWGELRESDIPPGQGVVAGYSQTQVATMTVQLREDDGRLADLEARGQLLAARAELWAGFPGFPPREHVRRFVGRVESALVSREGASLTLRATDGDLATALDANFEPPRAERYSDPGRATEVLPIVYGDLSTGGPGGLWRAACIDQAARVYALAGCPLATMARGQSITLYNRDDQELGAGYAYDPAHDYEGQGEVATVTFPAIGPATDLSFDESDNSLNSTSTDLSVLGANWTMEVEGSASNDGSFQVQVATANKALLFPDREVRNEGAGAAITIKADQSRNEPITVRAKGRADDAGALIENPVSVAADFLVNLVGLDSEYLHATALERARRHCASQGYRAAGIINRDQAVGTILSGLLGCFLVRWRLDQAGQLKVVVELGPGAVRESDSVGVLRELDTETAEIQQDLENLVNRFRLEFGRNFAANEYESIDEGEATQSLPSIRRHGSQSKTLKLDWVRDPATARAISQVLVDLHAEGLRLIQVPLDSLRLLPVEKGDLLYMTSAWLRDLEGLPLANQLVRVLEMTQNLDAGQTQLTVLDTGAYRTTAHFADGSCFADGSITGGADRDRAEY